MSDEYDKHVREIYQKVVIERAEQRKEHEYKRKSVLETFLIGKMDELQGKIVQIVNSPKITNQKKIKLKNAWSQFLEMSTIYLDVSVIDRLVMEQYSKKYKEKIIHG